MPNYRTQVTIQTADNLSANFATNTWHCAAGDLTELGLWHAALTTFYTTVDGEMSDLVKQTGGLQMKSYDLADPEPRAPVLTAGANLSTAGAPLPTECALVLSFQAVKQSGVPQARRRNRVYLPFLKATNNDSTGRPSATLISAVDGAATTLLAASGGGGASWVWTVYSPTDNLMEEVNDGWIDNEWDTQRRRGRKATSRSVF